MSHGTTESTCGRRAFVKLGIGAFAVLALPVAWRRTVMARRQIPVMGTIAEVAVVHEDRAAAQAAIEAAFQALRWVDRTMTRFQADSDVGRANRAPAGRAVHVTPETADVLAEAIRWARLTDGRFDPCLGRSVELWDVGRRSRPPADGEVRRLAGEGLYRHLEIDRAASGSRHVRLHDARAALDLGGIAKGYAVDRAVTALRSHGIRHALVNAGGDLYALGHSEDGDAWSIGVRSPERPDALAATLRVTDRAVATSGDYLAFFEHAGRRYHHLLDPRTGEPIVCRMRSLTIGAATCLEADAAATGLFGWDGREIARVAAAGGVETLHVA